MTILKKTQWRTRRFWTNWKQRIIWLALFVFVSNFPFKNKRVYLKIGEKGNKGFQSEKGEKGHHGLQGDKGLASTFIGDSGPKGDKGRMGPLAEKGSIGVDGDAGANGSDGNKGLDGLFGESGEMGLQGFSIKSRLSIELCFYFSNRIIRC